MKKTFFRMNALQTLALGFAVIILLGTFLLSLPISNRSGQFLPFVDALFTAASATCVTGLVVVDTYVNFTFFGQLVILLLIQIGGLGFMTIAVMFAMLLRRRIGLKERSNLKEAINSIQLGGVVRLTKRILIGTALLEVLGAILLAIRFVPEFGVLRGIWFAVFHSVSAFCNAGFDLMGAVAPYASLTPFASDLLVNLVVLALIILGGLGFIVWNDVIEHKWHVSKYLLHTKIMLRATLGIILVSTGLFLAFDWNGAFAGMNVGDKILAALFCAVTPRTAGFNTIDVRALSQAGSLLTMSLMIIGAGPGSTAGGIKLTTFVVMILTTISYIRGREDINVANRRLETETIRKAFSFGGLYVSFAFLGALSLLALNDFPFLDTTFEVLSAIGTVGLSRGITAMLSGVSKGILVSLMYLGRVGSLSVAMAFIEQKQTMGLRNPVEKIIIG